MFLKFRIKRLISKYFRLTDLCFSEIYTIINTKNLFKKYKYFIYMVCDYKKRKGQCTQVQLEALQRVLNG